MPGLAKMPTSFRARMYAESHQGRFTSTSIWRGHRRGHKGDRDKRPRQESQSERQSLDFTSLSRRSRPGGEAYCHYDTQNTKNKLLPTQYYTHNSSHYQNTIACIHHIQKDMSERNSQTPSTRQTPFEARLKKALRLSSVPC